MTTVDSVSPGRDTSSVGVVAASESLAAVLREAVRRAGVEVGDVEVHSTTRSIAAAVEALAVEADAVALALDGRDPDRTLVRAVEAATATTPVVAVVPESPPTADQATVDDGTDGDRIGPDHHGVEPSPPASQLASERLSSSSDWSGLRRRALDRAGAIRVGGIGGLVDALEPLAMREPIDGDGVAIVSNAGGPGVLAADAVGGAGLSLAEFGERTRDALDDLVPAEGSIRNPIDLLGDADLDAFATATSFVVEDDAVDAVVVVSSPSALFSFQELAATLANVVEGSPVPVVAALMGGSSARTAADELASVGVPVRFDPFAAVDCLGALARDDRRGFPPVDEPPAPDRGWWDDIDRAAAAAAIDAGDARGLCRAYGIPVADDGASTASSSVDSPSGDGDVRDESPTAEWTVDCSVQAVRDPLLGPTVVAGIDPFDDLFGDVRARLAPLSDRDATALFALDSGALLRGARGRRSADLDALKTIALCCSRIVIEQPEIEHFGLDPLRVTSEDIRVADASLTVDPDRTTCGQ